MKRQKIAEVITRMDWAGSPDIVRIICESISAMNEVKLIIGPSINLTSKTKQFLEKFKDNTIMVPYLKRDINPLWDFLTLLRLYFIFKKEKFDIVHTHTAKAGILGRIAAYLAGVRKIVHMPHGHNFYGYFGPFMNRLIVVFEKFVALFTNKIIVLTELEKSDYLYFRIKNPRGIEVVPSGLEVNSFLEVDASAKKEIRRKFGLEDDGFIVGMISRLEPVKGPQYFIESAFEVIKSIDNVIFLIVGDGSMCLELENEVRFKGKGDRFKFLGWRDDVLEMMPALDILVQPSLNEAVGRVLLEAQGLGIPVVATRVGGIPEVVKDDSTGIIVPPKDVEALTHAICNLLKDDERRSEMSVSARLWIKDRFSSSKMIQEILRIYNELV